MKIVIAFTVQYEFEIVSRYLITADVISNAILTCVLVELYRSQLMSL